ncbi:MFS transporter [Actinomycetospora atypica]|uniref:MFS transporter n=1 Tax=Actinomycetospora atypica TaxID=1290095 RepID=A0ABV9YHB7_9PSEU
MSTSGRRRALTIAVEHAVDDFYQGVVPALVPLLVAIRGYDFARAGGIVLAATLLASIAQPLFGVLADRRRVPGLRTAGMLTAAGGIGVVGLTDSFAATWVAVLVSGLGIAAYHPEAARAVHGTGTGDRGMGWFTFGGLAGFAAGPPVTAVVLGGLGLGATPLLALPAVVMAVVTATRRSPAPATSTGPVLTTAAPAGEDRRRFVWLTTVIMTRSVLFYGVSAFLVLYLVGRLGAPLAVAGLALTAFTTAGAFATLTSSRITARLGRAGTLLASYLAGAVALGLLLATTSPVLAVVVSGLLGVALGVPVPVHTTLGQSYLPRHLGLASAVTLGLSVSAGGLASPALGALADHHGITAAMLALLVFPALAAACSVPLLARRPRPS